MDGGKTFSFQVKATSPSTSTADNLKFCFVQCAGSGSGPFLTFLTPFKINLGSGSVKINSDATLPVNDKFMATFVQDVELKQWTLYFNDRKSKVMSFELNQLIGNSNKVSAYLRIHLGVCSSPA